MTCRRYCGPRIGVRKWQPLSDGVRPFTHRGICKKNAGKIFPGVFNCTLRNALEGKRDAAPDHPEIILRSVEPVPAEVSHDADVSGEAKFKATACFSFQHRIIVVAMIRDLEDIFRRFGEDGMRSAKSATYPAKNVRRKTRAADRISQSKRAVHTPHGIMSGEAISLDPDTDVFGEEIF